MQPNLPTGSPLHPPSPSRLAKALDRIRIDADLPQQARCAVRPANPFIHHALTANAPTLERRPARHQDRPVVWYQTLGPVALSRARFALGAFNLWVVNVHPVMV
jgi:hypothetical protein